MGRYQSIIDFVAVEMNPHLRRSCRSFYDDDGPQLRDIITEAQRAQLEARMLRLLHLAYNAYCEHRRLSWSGAVAEIERMAA
jgi:hypothetical protein